MVVTTTFRVLSTGLIAKTLDITENCFFQIDFCVLLLYNVSLCPKIVSNFILMFISEVF